jgi:predicted O-methyltransferase YrrM
VNDSRITDAARRVVRAFTYHPAGVAAKSLAGTALWKLAAPALRTRVSVPLSVFEAGGVGVHTEPLAVLRRLFPGAAANSVEGLRREYEELTEEVRARFDRGAATLARTENRGLESRTSLTLYASARLSRPATILETGVADGWSTFLLLHAVARNGSGSVHSVDIHADVGALLTDDERRSWNFHQIDERRPEAGFRALVGRLPAVDFYFHDADHRYLGQRFEYEAVLPQTAEGAVLGSDDVQASPAFVEFCARHELTPVLLVDRLTVSGWAMKP